MLGRSELKAQDKVALFDGLKMLLGGCGHKIVVLPGIAFGEEIASWGEVLWQAGEESAIEVEAVVAAK